MQIDILLVLQNEIGSGLRYLKLNNGKFHYDEHNFKGQRKTNVLFAKRHFALTFKQWLMEIDSKFKV